MRFPSSCHRLSTFSIVAYEPWKEEWGIENLEERWREDEYIDGVVLEFLREKFGG